MASESINHKFPSLQKNDVHVWYIDLGSDLVESSLWDSVLSIEEQERAGRFVFEQDRREFCWSHAALRVLLESYGVAPARDVAFHIAPGGKPALDPQHHCDWLQFNLAHTRGFAVCAFAYDRPVGIDVERLRIVSDADQIVQRFFALQEQAEYSATTAAFRPAAFFNAWTRKEAYLKALGVGLGRSLDSFAVTLDPKLPARLLQIDGMAAPATEWTLQDLSIDSETIIALAVPGTNLQVRCFDWKEWIGSQPRNAN